jgi:hypothetical protein
MQHRGTNERMRIALSAIEIATIPFDTKRSLPLR